ncbi:hypothetical protein A9Q74_08860 [Colwellia sp. 39_35_sub15_T18]|nr:hypothetical protein A9Q74_08860 [Colwellia sp. 39_35_sub15_T18]
MKKLITMLMLTLVTLSSQATLLSVDLDNTDYQVGDVLSADIVISDIELDAVGFDKLVASFNTNFLFDDSLLAFDNVTFGDKLDVDPDPFFASFQDTNLASSGNLFIQEVAQAFDFDLFFAQSGLSQFVLATVNFNVLQSGVGSLNFANATVGDEFGSSFIGVQAAGASFTVANSVAVPEPSTFILVIAAMMILLRRRAL